MSLQQDLTPIITSKYECKEIQKISDHLDRMQTEYTRLHHRKIKCASTACRREAMDIIKLCQQLRKTCLTTKKAMPVKARVLTKQPEERKDNVQA